MSEQYKSFRRNFRQEQCNDLLLAFSSFLGFGPRCDQWPYFCQFKDHLSVLKWEFIFNDRRAPTITADSKFSSVFYG